MNIFTNLKETIVKYHQVKNQKKEEKKRQIEAEQQRKKQARIAKINEFKNSSNRCSGCGKSFPNTKLVRFTISKSRCHITQLDNETIRDYYKSVFESDKTLIQPAYYCNIRQVLGDSSKSSKLACQNYVSNTIKGMCNPNKLFCKDCCEERAKRALELANEFKNNLENIKIYSHNYMGNVHSDPKIKIEISVPVQYNGREQAEKLLREKAAEKGCNIIYDFQFCSDTYAYTGIASKKVYVKKKPEKIDYIEEIKQLKELADQGIISKNEFQTKKEKLLNQ